MSDAAAALSEQIMADARRQAEPILARAAREAESILRAAREDAERERGQIVQRAEEKAAGQRLRVRARTELEVANILRTARERTLLLARERALEALRRQTAADDYREQLVALGLAGMRQMTGSRFELLMREADLAPHAEEVARAIARHAAEQGRQVEIAVAGETAGTIGGIIVRSADGRQLCDQTFEARLDRLWAQLRQEIAGELLEGVE